MQTLRDTAIQILNNTSPNYDAAREVVGQLLHLLQMFYSNTNWIEMSGGGVIYQPLGRVGFCCREYCRCRHHRRCSFREFVYELLLLIQVVMLL